MHEPLPATTSPRRCRSRRRRPPAGRAGAASRSQSWRSSSPIVAGAFVTFFTVDLGPSLRERAEREGSNFIHRPMHIGRLSAKITPGVFVVEDLVIEGLQPSDRPFLKAKKIEVVLPWWTIFRRELIVESVEMTDWDMVVETWPSSPEFPRGRHNFPKFTPRLEVHRSQAVYDDGAGTCSRHAERSRTRTMGRRGASPRAGCACR